MSFFAFVRFVCLLLHIPYFIPALVFTFLFGAYDLKLGPVTPCFYWKMGGVAKLTKILKF